MNPRLQQQLEDETDLKLVVIYIISSLVLSLYAQLHNPESSFRGNPKTFTFAQVVTLPQNTCSKIMLILPNLGDAALSPATDT